MKPVVILRYARTEGPGYFANYLEQRNRPWQLVCIDEGESVPSDCSRFSGLALMGGAMSVNDDLAWIDPVLRLIRNAVAADVPVIGHCLGGQLMSKAMGGSVARNPIKEIGWGPVSVERGPQAQKWLGELTAFEAFHWHGETFSIPPLATRLLSNRWCPNQAFAAGPHVAMQCHVEMTEELVESWLRTGKKEILQAAESPAVQNAKEIRRSLPERIAALNRVAAVLYSRWMRGLKD
jgi:GMP synthase-like glutamine amidotransferase